MDRVEQDEGLSGPSPAAPDDAVSLTRDLPSLCPYLATIDGNWRSSSPVREHRCVAVRPPVPLAFDKQRRLCLVADHVTCATYEAAIAARPSYATDATRRSRPIARTTPVVLDPTHFELRLPAIPIDRISGQGVLVGLMGLAFAAILIARPGGNGGAANGDSSRSSPTPAATSAAAASPVTRPSAPATAAPVVTARPVASPAANSSAPPSSPTASSEPATSGSTYKVKSGDTLSAIAARFGTTVKVLVTLNHIADPSKLHVGQVLQLP